MQPISTSGSPVEWSRPVVSVSKTISRIARISDARRWRASSAGKLVHQGRNRPLGFRRARAGVDQVVGPLALLGVGQLQREDLLEARGGHPRAREYPRALHFGRGGDHQDRIDLV